MKSQLLTLAALLLAHHNMVMADNCNPGLIYCAQSLMGKGTQTAQCQTPLSCPTPPTPPFKENPP